MKNKYPIPLVQSRFKHPIQTLAMVSCVLTLAYWLGYASDRYISEAHVVIEKTDLASSQGFDLGGLLLGGTGSGGNHGDQLLLRDRLLSTDMLRQLDARLHLREHYSDPRHDLLSRLWFKDASIEKFHKYYLERVSVEYDDYAGVLVIKAQAYDPQTARALTQALVTSGEQFMNDLAHELAREQVDFLDQQIRDVGRLNQEARQALLRYQNQHNLVSPQSTTENLASIVNGMESQLSTLKANRTALLGYLMPASPSVVELDLQIAALERQIASEKAKLTAPHGKTLNATVEEYQRLEMNAAFTQDLYQTALAAFEKGRFEAARTLKKMSVLQAPTLPEYPLEPKRFYNSFVSVLLIGLGTGILHLIVAVIRDHKD